MANTPKSRDELARLTNLEDLVPAPPAPDEQRFPQVDPEPPAPPAKRSTTDAFESNFGHVDVIEGLSKSRVKPWTRVFAWIFLAGPFLAIGTVGAWSMLEELGRGQHDASDYAVIVLMLAFNVGVAGFWPYILLRRG
jgi:hypothetical protein